MAKRSIELIETVDMMFNEHHDFGTSNLLDSESAINQFFRTIAMKTLEVDPSQYFQQNKEKIEKQALFFIDPNQSNQRLVMQQGLFLFPYTLDEKNHIYLLNSNTGVIKINKELREELQIYLDTIGINSYRLMPDLSVYVRQWSVRLGTIEQKNHYFLKRLNSSCEENLLCLYPITKPIMKTL